MKNYIKSVDTLTRKEKWMVYIILIWVLIHSILFASSNPTYFGERNFWPFQGDFIKYGKYYDFSEFSFYVIIPLAALIFYSIIFKGGLLYKLFKAQGNEN